MICEKCKECWNYMVSEVGCYGSIQTCKHFYSDDDEDIYLITGIEDGWIKANEETWNKYLEAKKRLGK